MVAQLCESKNHWNLSLVKFVEHKFDLIRLFKNYVWALIPKGGINVGYQSTTNAQSSFPQTVIDTCCLCLDLDIYSQAEPLRSTGLIIFVAHQCNFQSSAFWAPGVTALSGHLQLTEPSNYFWPIGCEWKLGGSFLGFFPVGGALDSTFVMFLGTETLTTPSQPVMTRIHCYVMPPEI